MVFEKKHEARKFFGKERSFWKIREKFLRKGTPLESVQFFSTFYIFYSLFSCNDNDELSNNVILCDINYVYSLRLLH
jgi:hypothetical protein